MYSTVNKVTPSFIMNRKKKSMNSAAILFHNDGTKNSWPENSKQFELCDLKYI